MRYKKCTHVTKMRNLTLKKNNLSQDVRLLTYLFDSFYSRVLLRHKVHIAHSS